MRPERFAHVKRLLAEVSDLPEDERTAYLDASCEGDDALRAEVEALLDHRADSPEILENNIDGGIPVWPSFYMIGKNGEILISLKGKDLKDRIISEQFKRSGAPEARKRELDQLATSVSDFENILMIVK